MWILCVVCFDGPLIMVLLVWMYCLLRPSGNFNLDQTNKTVSCRKKSEIFMYIMHCSPNYEHKNSSHNLCKLVALSVCSFILKTFKWIFTLGSSCSIRKYGNIVHRIIEVNFELEMVKRSLIKIRSNCFGVGWQVIYKIIEFRVLNVELMKSHG